MKSEYLKIDVYHPQEERIKYTVEVIEKGGLVVLPTETVYGIGFDPCSQVAQGKIREIKKYRKDKPYTLCILKEWLRNYPIEELSGNNFEIISDLLPGAITFILGLKGKGSSGFRISTNLIVQSILANFSQPLALTSANISQQTPARCVQEAMDNLWNRVDLIIDGGPSPLCLSSLVLDLTQNPVKILRTGPPFITEEVKRRFKI